MIVINKESPIIKKATSHVLKSDGLTCSNCLKNFSPFKWDPGSIIYETTFSSDHSDMIYDQPDEGVEYQTCKQ